MRYMIPALLLASYDDRSDFLGLALQRHAAERPAAPEVIVGSNDILANAVNRANQCGMPPGLTPSQSGCAGGNPFNACSGDQITRQTQSAANQTTSQTLEYVFETNFKLAKLTVPSAIADTITLTSVKAGGVEVLRNGSINGGPFSSGNQESGGELDAPTITPGQRLKITMTMSAAPGATQPITVAGVQS